MRRIYPALIAAALALPVGCLSSGSPSQRAVAGKSEPRPEKEKAEATESTADSISASAAPPRDAAPPPSVPKSGSDNVAPARKPTVARNRAPNVAPRAKRAEEHGSALGLGGLSGGAVASGALAQRGDISKVQTRTNRQQPREPLAFTTVRDAEAPDRNKFVHAGTNPFTSTLEDKLSTFAIDVDTGSYTYARRYLKVGNKPQAASVRVEEWVNAFHYDYTQPQGDVPFAVDMEAGPSPFHEGRHIVRVGIQGKTITNDERKPVHITFLVDVSGSMGGRGKLNMVKKSMDALVDSLRDDDSVAIVTYAGRTEEVLSATKGSDKATIRQAITNLRTGGGTNMGSGMELAYRNANKFLGDGRNARVVVMSDGDANIGRTRHASILDAVKGYVSEGVTLSTVGYGTGNYNDHLMEQLANAGNGNYSYIDGPEAIEKIFGQDLVGTLEVIAKDVKIQVEFNPSVVSKYRLIGYENRDVADKDFRNDKVDAGEIGAGHSVTALYEVELTDKATADLATVRVRYKKPRGTKAAEVSHTLTAAMVKESFGKLDDNTRMATALAVASEHLRGSEYAAGLSLEDARALAAEAVQGPYAKERRAFVSLLSHDRLGGTVSRR